jgi:hypothetical protein
MTKSHLFKKEKTIGDTAVDGLTAGLAAGTVMMLVLIIGGLLGQTPLLQMVGYFDPAQGGRWLTGLLAHLAVSAIYGVIFALLLERAVRIRPFFRQWGWLWGAGYGLVLYGLARGVLLTAVDFPLEQIAIWNLILGHLVYGLALGLQLRGQS